MGKFFIDTADIDYIKGAWEKLAPFVDEDDLVGVTTNPSAMAKVDATTISAMEAQARSLCALVSDIRQDNKGVVYVQGPSSTMHTEELVDFAEMIKGWSDGQTKIGMKIAPFYRVLADLHEIPDIELNVTGIADCSTALRCLSYDVRYVSIIPGRMEEKGINAVEQIAFVNERENDGKDIITGSMRTMEGLARAIMAETVPTIGGRVFDQIFEKNAIKQFVDMWSVPAECTGFTKSPLVTQDMLDLSEAFFVQMDELGADVYADWKNTK
jgi:transaldolase